MDLNEIRKNAYLNQNQNDNKQADDIFSKKEDKVILSNQAKNNQNVSNVKKFTFQSISKVIDEIQNQKEQKNQNSQNNTNNQQS